MDLRAFGSTGLSAVTHKVIVPRSFFDHTHRLLDRRLRRPQAQNASPFRGDPPPLSRPLVLEAHGRELVRIGVEVPQQLPRALHANGGGGTPSPARCTSTGTFAAAGVTRRRCRSGSSSSSSSSSWDEWRLRHACVYWAESEKQILVVMVMVVADWLCFSSRKRS